MAAVMLGHYYQVHHNVHHCWSTPKIPWRKRNTTALVPGDEHVVHLLAVLTIPRRTAVGVGSDEADHLALAFCQRYFSQVLTGVICGSARRVSKAGDVLVEVCVIRRVIRLVVVAVLVEAVARDEVVHEELALEAVGEPAHVCRVCG